MITAGCLRPRGPIGIAMPAVVSRGVSELVARCDGVAL